MRKGAASLSLLVSLLSALALGWFRYPMRLAGTHELDGPNTLLCLACLAGLVAGVHAFGRWFACQRPVPTAWPLPRTLTLVGLVLLMFVAGITAIGILHETVWLVRAALTER